MISLFDGQSQKSGSRFRDFEKADESSNASDGSENDNQFGRDTEPSRVDEESKEDSHPNNHPDRLIQSVKTTHNCPTPKALASASTPSGAFFYFLQPQLWEDIAAESDYYFEASIGGRVGGAKQLHRELKHSGFKAKSRDTIREDVLKIPRIEVRELCVFIGLLLARSIVPNKEKLANHWKTREEGAIPRGCFGHFMTRDRFMHLSRNLHFSRNDDPNAATDRAWKLRPVIDALQDRFAAGYTPPPSWRSTRQCCLRALRSIVCAFTSKTNPTNEARSCLCCAAQLRSIAFGTKPKTRLLFLVPKLAYHLKYTVGKERVGQTNSTDHKSGPAAVVCNLQQVFGPTAPPSGEMRLVVMDRFYSSVPLSMQLLTMGFYSIGTVRTDRQGLGTKLIPKQKKGDKKKPPKIPKNRPANIERATFIAAEALHVPTMRVLRWWDTRAVHILSRGGSVEQDRIVRRDTSTGEQQ
ncbi:Hypothetical protein PHPALM_14824 [Phytophthora palmivora]|uniref:PiggyBac transposable element-derived protein domain-containing protein n=1 Tax=Phytophthora palmivora TaxID=4796 RepID=A0A2P4XTT6_9STRA|nr:Hypothetical protein PHPALM_14824 [Phytophthora palmivora]